MKAFLALLFTCLVSLVECQIPVYSIELETQLRNELLTGYEKFQRPTKIVFVNTELNLLSIKHLDIKEQQLSISAYLQLQWSDTRLEWKSNSNYSSITFIFSNERFLWGPSVIIENSVDDVDVISKQNVLMRIRSDGVTTWTPGGVYTTSCEMDVTYYPLDIQTCDIYISTWAYTANEVMLTMGSSPIKMDGFQQNGEWELLETSYSTATTVRDYQSFSRLKFTLKLRRRPLFHMMNTLFPVVLMAFLTVSIFKLPLESGERVGLSLTILLAYAVYLTLISGEIPQTSLSASILSAYLASILLLQTVAVFLTVIYLDIYFTPEEKPVPKWLQYLAARFGCCRTQYDTDLLIPSTGSNDVVLSNVEMNQVSPSGKNSKILETKNGVQHTKNGLGSNAKNETESAWTADLSNTKYTWKDISALLDKITMYLYLFLVIVVTLVCTAVIASSYSKSS